VELVEPELLPDVPFEVVPEFGPLISEVPVGEVVPEGEVLLPDVPPVELPEGEVPDEPLLGVGVSEVGEDEVPVLLVPDVLPVPPIVLELPEVPPPLGDTLEPEVLLPVSDDPDDEVPPVPDFLVVVDPVLESLPEDMPEPEEPEDIVPLESF